MDFMLTFSFGFINSKLPDQYFREAQEYTRFFFRSRGGSSLKIMLPRAKKHQSAKMRALEGLNVMPTKVDSGHSCLLKRKSNSTKDHNR